MIGLEEFVPSGTTYLPRTVSDALFNDAPRGMGSFGTYYFESQQWPQEQEDRVAHRAEAGVYECLNSRKEVKRFKVAQEARNLTLFPVIFRGTGRVQIDRWLLEPDNRQFALNIALAKAKTALREDIVSAECRLIEAALGLPRDAILDRWAESVDHGPFRPPGCRWVRMEPRVSISTDAEGIAVDCVRTTAYLVPHEDARRWWVETGEVLAAAERGQQRR